MYIVNCKQFVLIEERIPSMKGSDTRKADFKPRDNEIAELLDKGCRRVAPVHRLSVKRQVR
ncbi:hypothetical protein A6F57_12955 [Alteromonas stellipolaris]|jgi:hypothetical protein|nr:hypothetical protein A6F57_12955 [Alteromonas stellipolaris]